MKYVMILTGMFLALAVGGAAAEDPKKPVGGASAQAAGQGQADAQAGQGGATATGTAAGSANAEAGESTASLAQGTEINAELTKPVDAGKAKPGDPVTAKATKDVKSDGEVVVPRGSRLIGRVTQARPHGSSSAGGGSASQLGIVFDRAVLKDGREVVLNGSVAAIGAARAAGTTGGNSYGAGAGGAGGMAGSAGGAGGGLAGAVGGTVGGVANTTAGAAGNLGTTVGTTADAAARSTGAVGGFDAAGGLQSGSRGVFGVRDLNIAADAASGASGSVISSPNRTVRLDGGTQMLLVAGGSAGKQAAEAPPEREREPVNRN